MATAITTVTATGRGVTGKRVIAAGITTAAGMAAVATGMVTAVVMAVATAAVMAAATVAVMAVAATTAIAINANANGRASRHHGEARLLRSA